MFRRFPFSAFPAILGFGAGLVGGERSAGKRFDLAREGFLPARTAGTPSLANLADEVGVSDICDACDLTILGASADNAGCPPSVKGDIDRDGDIAIDDYLRLRNCLRGPEITACGFPEVRVYLDSDWDVDLRDFAIFQNCFSGENSPADPSCSE